tara:strand:+ start:599 stop:889 length:291 start_codon:yes stop_codon:yes gene_type:complete
MEKTNDIDGTHLQGYIHATYYQLLEAFGKPHDNGDGYKTDVEWAFKFADGTVATLYNWKNGKNYLGEEGSELKDMFTWNIGGRSERAVTKIKEQIK